MTAGRKSETYIHGGAGNSGMWVLDGPVVFRQDSAVKLSKKKNNFQTYISYFKPNSRLDYCTGMC